jgi:hypothetical protein
VLTVAAERGLFSVDGGPFGEGDPFNVVMASYGFWEVHLGEDRSAIGRNITLDGQPFTLIGVMPEGFQFPYTSSAQRLWIPWEDRPNSGTIPTAVWTESWRG